MMQSAKLNTILILVSQSIFSVLADYLVYSTTGTIGAENITYIKIARRGTFRIELTSIKGDADLYVSDQTLTPDYLNYELQSTTCGKDVIHIAEELNRPVGVGIYGHTSHEQSTYEFDVYEEDGAVSQSYQDYSFSEGASTSNIPQDEEEESLMWTIFVGILKVLFDVLV